MSYLAIVPLALYAVLLGAGAVPHTTATIVVLLLVEAVAIALTIRELHRRYAAVYRRQQTAHDRTRHA